MFQARMISCAIPIEYQTGCYSALDPMQALYVWYPDVAAPHSVGEDQLLNNFPCWVDRRTGRHKSERLCMACPSLKTSEWQCCDVVRRGRKREPSPDVARIRPIQAGRLRRGFADWPNRACPNIIIHWKGQCRVRGLTYTLIFSRVCGIAQYHTTWTPTVI